MKKMIAIEKSVIYPHAIELISSLASVGWVREVAKRTYILCLLAGFGRKDGIRLVREINQERNCVPHCRQKRSLNEDLVPQT